MLALIDRQQLALAARPHGDASVAAAAAAASPLPAGGGGAVVHASLCQTATWLAQFGARMPTRAEYAARVTRLLWRLGGRVRTDANLRYMPPDDALRLSHTPPARVLGFNRWWTDGAASKL